MNNDDFVTTSAYIQNRVGDKVIHIPGTHSTTKAKEGKLQWRGSQSKDFISGPARKAVEVDEHVHIVVVDELRGVSCREKREPSIRHAADPSARAASEARSSGLFHVFRALRAWARERRCASSRQTLEGRKGPRSR